MLPWSFQPQVVLNDDSPDAIMFMGYFTHPTKQPVELTFMEGLLDINSKPTSDFVVPLKTIQEVVSDVALGEPNGTALHVATDDPDTAIKAICEHIVKAAERDSRFNASTKPFMSKAKTTYVRLMPVELV